MKHFQNMLSNTESYLFIAGRDETTVVNNFQNEEKWQFIKYLREMKK